MRWMNLECPSCGVAVVHWHFTIKHFFLVYQIPLYLSSSVFLYFGKYATVVWSLSFCCYL